MSDDHAFWSSKRVFLTGHTGFKGAWLTLLLHRLGAHVCGFSLPEAVSTPSLFDAAGLSALCDDRRGDIRDVDALSGALQASRPDVLVHMAPQPIVRAGVSDPLSTFDVNVMGTAKVLQAARQVPGLGAVVVVTSDKCYENRERVWPYREDEAMGGSDPYSASKGAAELVTAAFARTYFHADGAAIVSVHAGNVIGGGDWAADRLIPDLVRASRTRTPVEIRSPGAVRPWQHVLDPLYGYLQAARRALVGRSMRPHDAWNFGPNPGEELTVREVVETFRTMWSDPLDVCYAETAQAAGEHREANLLRVDATKAKVELGWGSALTNGAAVAMAANWYSNYHSDSEVATVRGITERQLEIVLGV